MRDERWEIGERKEDTGRGMKRTRRNAVNSNVPP